MDIMSLLKQPTTIEGLSWLGSAASFIATYLMTKDATVSGVIAAGVKGAVQVAMPDNSGAQSSIEKLVADSVGAVAHQKLAAMLPLIAQDAMAVVATSIAKPVPSPGAPVVPVVPAIQS